MLWVTCLKESFNVNKHNWETLRSSFLSCALLIVIGHYPSKIGKTSITIHFHRWAIKWAWELVFTITTYACTSSKFHFWMFSNIFILLIVHISMGWFRSLSLSLSSSYQLPTPAYHWPQVSWYDIELFFFFPSCWPMRHRCLIFFLLPHNIMNINWLLVRAHSTKLAFSHSLFSLYCVAPAAVSGLVVIIVIGNVLFVCQHWYTRARSTQQKAHTHTHILTRIPPPFYHYYYYYYYLRTKIHFLYILQKITSGKHTCK